ncbi:MAG: SynChlorMet cassette radical SAM/SPASM protein ScmE [Anaerolineales bacterium]
MKAASDARMELDMIPIMRTPRNVDIEITARCNLRCRYCYFFNNPEVEYRDLPTKEWLTFFEELGRSGVMRVCLGGGEPFIREDLPELLQGIVRNRMRFSFASNGGLIDDEIAAVIAATSRCDYVQVSVDGSSPEIHDTGRGKGSFEGAVRGIRTLQRHDIMVAVRVTIHRHNVHDLENTARFLLEDLGLERFGTNSAGYLGSCRLNDEEMLLTIEDRQIAMSTLQRLATKYEGRISAAAGPLADVRYWNEMEEARTTGAAPFGRGGNLTACGCPANKIAVRADGAIVPCTLLAHIDLGRINQDSFVEIWQHSPAFNQLRERRAIPLTEFEFCKGCKYIPYCTGNCPALAYTLVGEVDHPSPDACLKRFLEAGGKLPEVKGTGRAGNRLQGTAKNKNLRAKT